MQSIGDYQKLFLAHLESFSLPQTPKRLFEPIGYILDLGGKRIRPVLTLMAAEACGGSVKDALPAASAVELFHNFSLIHDDIMDAADLRRGQATVHQKWDTNTGILSGDALLVIAYQQLNHYPKNLFHSLTQLFSQTALEVCVGQQMDMDFEQQTDVSLEDYLEMIRLKTAVLLGCALQMGAHVGGGSNETVQHLYDFGVHLGLAFQLQDDYLDAFGDPKTFGKKVGGDIVENKKTILYHLALEHATPQQREELLDLMSQKPADEAQKVEKVKALYVQTSADKKTQQQLALFTQKAMNSLDQTQLASHAYQHMRAFATDLMHRTQ
ncbi:MAG: polyprenyl synthetase family protein [Flavobacteriaceae bacterium]